MKPLLILAALLIGLPVFGQSTWRNFFTTNQNPIVEVVAGSNATVQASTVGVNLRRFTVNSTASGGGQTNISWTGVTNLQSAQVPLSVITNAQYLTNWSLLPTNYVPPQSTHATNADFVNGTLTNSTTGNATTSTHVTTGTLTNIVYGTNISGTIYPANLATNSALANQVLTATSSTTAKWSSTLSTVVGAYLSVGYSSTVAYTPPNAGGSAGTSVEARASVPWLIPCTFTNLMIKVTAAPGAGTNMVITLFTNGVASLLVATIVGNGSLARATNTTAGVFVDYGTSVSLEYKGNNTSASASGGIGWSMLYFQ